MKFFKLIALIYIIFCIFVDVCKADIIHLKNGRKLEGKIIKETDKILLIEIPGGEIGINKLEIARIEKGEFNPAETMTTQTISAIKPEGDTGYTPDCINVIRSGRGGDEYQRAILELALVRDARAIHAIVELANSTLNPYVKSSALIALSKIDNTEALNSELPNILPLLYRLSTNDDFANFKTIIAKCVDKKNIPYFLEAMKRENKRMVFNMKLFDVLCDLTEKGELLAPLYNQVLKDEDFKTRKNAVTKISLIMYDAERGENRSPQDNLNTEILIKGIMSEFSGLIMDKDIDMRRDVAKNLKKIQKIYNISPPISMLEKAINSTKDEKIREDVVDILFRLGNESSMAVIEGFLDKADAGTRAEVMEYLRNEENARYIANKAQILICFLNSKNPELRELAVELFGLVEDLTVVKNSIPIIKDVLEKADKDKTICMLKALNNLKDKSALKELVPTIIALWKTEDPAIGSLTTGLLTGIGKVAYESMVPFLGDENLRLQKKMLEGLLKTQDETLVAVLIEGLNSDNINVKKNSLKILKKLTGKNFGYNCEKWNDWFIKGEHILAAEGGFKNILFGMRKQEVSARKKAEEYRNIVEGKDIKFYKKLKYETGERENRALWEAKKKELEDFATLKWEEWKLTEGHRYILDRGKLFLINKPQFGPFGALVDTPKENIIKKFGTYEKVDYKQKGNEEWITFWNKETTERGDTVVFYIIDGKIKGWVEVPPASRIDMAKEFFVKYMEKLRAEIEKEGIKNER